MTTVSVVVPVYSGEDHLEELVARLGRVRASWATQFTTLELAEVLLVDDAAIDGSAAVIRRLQSQFDWVHGITLSRNFGQHPATIAGVLHSQGDWVATLDEDLQHDPAHLELLLRRALHLEADVVYGEPTGSVHGAARRDLSSRFVKRTLAMLAGEPSIALFSSFRMCRGPVVRAAASICGYETYFDIALTWHTDRFATQPVEMVDERYQSRRRSGYRLGTLASHARRLLISSRPKVLRLAGVVGMISVVAAAFFAVRAVIQALAGSLGSDVPGWASTFVGLTSLGGLTIVMLVLVLEYLLGIVLHVQGKPTFFVVDRSGDRELLRRLESSGAAPLEP